MFSFLWMLRNGIAGSHDAYIFNIIRKWKTAKVTVPCNIPTSNVRV